MKRLLFVILPLFLAACASAKLPTIGDEGRQYNIKDIQVGFANHLDDGFMPQLDGESKAELAERTVKSLTAQLRKETASTLTGSKPAILTVKLTQMDIASTLGKIAVKSQSGLSGVVALVDAKTGKTIVFNNIVVGDGVNMGGNVGGALSLIANVATSIRADPVTTVSEKFAKQTKTWLLRKN